MRPFGKIGSIVEATDTIGFDGGAAFGKALSFHWLVRFPPPLSIQGCESGALINIGFS